MLAQGDDVRDPGFKPYYSIRELGRDSAVPEGLSEVSSFLERFEAEQKARQKAHNDRTALRRKALAQAQRPA
jgi:hypothetical protein